MNLEKNFNPSFVRENTEEIGGIWQFSLDKKSWRDIRVPYAPQSVLSGIGYTDFIPECYYKKSFTVKKTGERILLHFGAVDYRALVYINGKFAVEHEGGFTPFETDITDLCADGENELALTVYDQTQDIPFGKQSYKQNSFGCFYTRTTGIWQPVWLEFVPENRVKEFYFTPDVKTCALGVDLLVTQKGSYEIEVFLDNKKVGYASGDIQYRASVTIPLQEKKLWSVGNGNLYEVKIKYGKDTVFSYFGLRQVQYDGYKFLINGEEVFQNLVLDQGFYPDGIYTAPSIDAMQKDINLALDLGFNGARLHQKVFDPRFLYLCDKAGYMVWGEFPSWGVDFSNVNYLGKFLAQWQEVLRRDFNHPSIVTWCPLNEVWGAWEDNAKRPDLRFVDGVYDFTKTLDITRPCVDVSGGIHGRASDLYDFHSYEAVENIQKYLEEFNDEEKLKSGTLYFENRTGKYIRGLPINLSEYGGIAFGYGYKGGGMADAGGEEAVQSEESWGYGKGATDGDNFVERFRALVETVFRCQKLSGVCYTQLYDVEQEQNGFYYYDRSDKLTKEQKAEIKKINQSR